MHAVRGDSPAPDTDPAVADPTLLDALRELSPEERLLWNDRAATAALELRDAFEAAQPDDVAGASGGERD